MWGRAGLPSSDSADLANGAKTFQSFHQFSAKTRNTLYTTCSPDHFGANNSSSFRGGDNFSLEGANLPWMSPLVSLYFPPYVPLLFLNLQICLGCPPNFLNLEQTPLSKKTHRVHTFPGSGTIIDFRLNFPDKTSYWLYIVVSFPKKSQKKLFHFCVKCDIMINVAQIAPIWEKVNGREKPNQSFSLRYKIEKGSKHFNSMCLSRLF